MSLARFSAEEEVGEEAEERCGRVDIHLVPDNYDVADCCFKVRSQEANSIATMAYL